MLTTSFVWAFSILHAVDTRITVVYMFMLARFIPFLSDRFCQDVDFSGFRFSDAKEGVMGLLLVVMHGQRHDGFLFRIARNFSIINAAHGSILPPVPL